eukprot:TCONS_00011354-protein
MANLEKLKVRNEDEDERTFLCGFRDWTPKCLQFFADIHWFIPFISLCSLVQGMLVSGFINASIPHIEREFGLTSTQSGILLASNDLTGFLFVMFVSYYGEKGHKPTWLGAGSILIGIGAFIYSLPKFMKGDYQPLSTTATFDYNKYELCHHNSSSTIIDLPSHSCTITDDSSGLYLTILCVANMLMGIGATPLNTLGAAYLDENVSPKNSPIYIGIWYGMIILGPSVGFSAAAGFLNEYTNMDGKIPDGIDQLSPLYVGRWWYPFATLGWILVFNGFILMLFPKKMPGALKIREKAIKKGHVQEESKELEEIRKRGFIGFLKATLMLLKNKYLVLVLLASSAKMFIATGVSPFFSKYLTMKYGADPTKANSMIGVILVIGALGGLIIGSIIMRFLDIKKSIKKATIISIVLGVLNCFMAFSYEIKGCDPIDLVSSRQSITFDNGTNAFCNNNCGCLKEHYNPVCANGITYLSPCMAGCTTQNNITDFTNCACVTPFNVSTKTNENAYQMVQSVTEGKCDQNCDNIYIFLIFIILTIMTSFIGVTPKNMITLRSVPANQRSFAMGLQFLMVRLLGMLPGPIVVGQLFDSTCLIWKYDSCGAKTNCAEYKLESLSNEIKYVSLAGNLINLAFFLMAIWVYKDPHGEEQGVEVIDGKHTTFDEIGQTNPLQVTEDEKDNDQNNNLG